MLMKDHITSRTCRYITWRI